MSRKHYTPAFRTKVVKYAEETSIKTAARKFKVDPASVKRWKAKLRPGNPAHKDTENRNPDGTFKPGNRVNPDGCSGAQKRAQTLAADLAVDGYELYRKLLDVELAKDPSEIDFGRVRLILKDAAEYGLTKPKQVTETQHTGKDGERLERTPRPEGHEQYQRDIAGVLLSLGFAAQPDTPAN